MSPPRELTPILRRRQRAYIGPPFEVFAFTPSSSEKAASLVRTCQPEQTEPPRTRCAQSRGLLVWGTAELIYMRECTASSLADIATAAGVPIDNVYHYFKTKEALPEAVVALWLERSCAQCSAKPAGMDRPTDRIRHFLRFLSESSQDLARHGCPFGTLSVELEKYDSRAGRSFQELDHCATGLDENAVPADG